MKILSVMVGPQGSGKSTLAKDFQNSDPDAVIISQDELGQRGHMVAFEQAIKQGRNIIVDRINHTREQRARYIKAANDAGYVCEIFVQHMSFKECYDRIVTRQDHPTIKDRATALQALRMFFTQYERPHLEEADNVVYLSEYDSQLLDLNNSIEIDDDAKLIIIGDVHGCYDELMALLAKFGYRKGKDLIIFCGDLINRGPKIREVLEFVMNTPNVYSVMGNHEWKLARHLMNEATMGKSAVKISHGLQETLDQCAGMDQEQLLMWLWSLPLSIKYLNNYIVHAGINPRYPMHRQNREFLLYARNFDPASNSFSNDDAPYWYEHDLHRSFSNKRIFFGHEIHNITNPLHFATMNKNKNVFPMDGGCYFGWNLLGCSIPNYSNDCTFDYVPSKQKPTEHEPLFESWSEPYEDRVKAGYLNKSVDGALVLYNYTDKCAFEKKWDKYTKESRGLIFEAETGKVIARPFPKFFNVGELDESRMENLPNENYECFEKMDGSLGIIFHYDGKWRVATRGSFTSPQAQRAQEMLLKKYNMENINTDITLLAEIIYPENRHNVGARLVIDYGSEDMLVLLAAYNRKTGKELERGGVVTAGAFMKMPVVASFSYTISQMIEMQKTLPADKEGFVVRYESGLRVKIKGQEYMRMHKILNSITPLFFWEMMTESKDFSVPGQYIASIPEECRDEAMDIIIRLKQKRSSLMSQIEEDFQLIPIEKPNDINDKSYKRDLGIWLQKNGSTLRHASVIFPYVLDNKVAIEKYLNRMVRPTGNILEG